MLLLITSPEARRAAIDNRPPRLVVNVRTGRSPTDSLLNILEYVKRERRLIHYTLTPERQTTALDTVGA